MKRFFSLTNKNRSALLPLLLAFSMVGCGTENPFSRGPRIDHESSIEVPETVSFSADVVPVLSTCISCHNDGTGGWTYAGGTAAYDEAFSVIDKDEPVNSLLLVKATGGAGHGGGALFSRSSPQYEILLRWVEQGALDN